MKSPPVRSAPHSPRAASTPAVPPTRVMTEAEQDAADIAYINAHLPLINRAECVPAGFMKEAASEGAS